MKSDNLYNRFKKIELLTKRYVNNAFVGKYISKFKGLGIEFDDIKEYEYGDDTKFIDWNVTARYRKPFIKKYTEERELNIYIVIDVSSSTFFGTKNLKSTLINEIASIISFCAIKNNDKVALVLFSDIINKFIPLNKGNKHFQRILREILKASNSDSKSTNFNVVAEFLKKVQKKKSIMFVISDLLTNDMPYKKLSSLQFNHEIILIKIIDKLEEIISNMGTVKLIDSENNQAIWINSKNKLMQSAINKSLESYSTHQKEILTKNKIDYLELNTYSNYIHTLVRFLKYRK